MLQPRIGQEGKQLQPPRFPKTHDSPNQTNKQPFRLQATVQKEGEVEDAEPAEVREGGMIPDAQFIHSLLHL